MQTAVLQRDFTQARDHANTAAQILLIQDKEKIYLREYGPYLVALRWCESRFNDAAINPKDSDGTPSYSRFQYKIGTFLNLGKEYDLIPETANFAWARKNVMDGELQEKLTVGMIKNGVNLRGQFPDCHRRYGFLLSRGLESAER